MSHQTGIHATAALMKFFGTCKCGNIRVVKISINNEELVLSGYKEVQNTWDADFDKLVIPLIEDDQPCYILYRLDTKTDSGYEWLFISWSPDSSTVRQKMLYASTKATLKQEFGTSQIKEEVHATVVSEVSLDGYRKYKRAVNAPVPLTMREEELQELKKSEVHTDIALDTRQQTLGGVSFPITEAAKQAILDMSRNSYNYLQFKIDLDEEEIHLSLAENVHLDKLRMKVPNNTARYHLYRFNHTHEGDYTESVVFIYSMPGYNCSIKERMLYSSCKNPLIDVINGLGLIIDKKLEIDDGAALTEEFLYEEIHPTKNLHRPKFAKPKGPPGRGPKRITRTQNDN